MTEPAGVRLEDGFGERRSGDLSERRFVEDRPAHQAARWVFRRSRTAPARHQGFTRGLAVKASAVGPGGAWVYASGLGRQMLEAPRRRDSDGLARGFGFGFHP